MISTALASPIFLAALVAVAERNTHGRAYTLLFIYMGVAGVGGVVLGNLFTERYLKKRTGWEPLTYGRQIVINALMVVACAVAIFAVLSFATMLVMKFML